MSSRRWIVIAVVAAIIVIDVRAGEPHDLIQTFLRDRMGFSRGELEAIHAGRPVAKNLGSPEPEDVNVFGAIRLTGAPEAYVRELRAIDVYERKLHIDQVGKFHEPPQLSDLDGLTIEPSDLVALQSCRPGNCALQLSAAAMKRFQT